MFPGGGMGNMQAMMKKVQKMQNEMLKAQEELKKRTVEATVGGGAVTVVVSGRKELVSIKINPDAVDVDDIEMLEDIITTAINQTSGKAIKVMEEKMKSVTGGISIPGLF